MEIKSKSEVWHKWCGQDIIIGNAVRTQGKIIKAYLESNKHNLKKVPVRTGYEPKGQFTEMLQMPETYNTYYYSDGSFYHELDFANREKQKIPGVDMIVGYELTSLWKNRKFIESLRGM